MVLIIDKYKKSKQVLISKTFNYFIILRAGTDFHLCGLKVDLSLLGNTEINKSRSANDSLWIENFIEDEYGHVKIY